MLYNTHHYNHNHNIIYIAKCHTVRIQVEHDISRARLMALDCAKHLGFSKSKAYYLATAVSELASNLMFHTKNGGEIILSVVECHNVLGIEVCAIDTGPGIKNIELAMQEGYSTVKGSLGCGLPGVKRLMDAFYIESHDTGTIVKAIKWHDSHTKIR